MRKVDVADNAVVITLTSTQARLLAEWLEYVALHALAAPAYRSVVDKVLRVVRQ